jgi:hypothetical protein
MCPRSVAAARAFYVKGAAFVEEGAVEFHIAVGMWPLSALVARVLDLEFDVASRQARPT